MKTITTWLFTMAICIPISLAAQTPSAGRISGSQLVERWTSPPADGSDRSAAQILARQYVDGYLAGVADASEGTSWCNTTSTKAHELDAEVMGVIKSTPTPTASATVAAKLIVAALAKRFPCDGGRK